MIHKNPYFKTGLLFIMVVAIFFLGFFVGGQVQLFSDSNDEAVLDTFNKTGKGRQLFGATLKQGEHQCSISVSNNTNPDGTPSYLYVVADSIISGEDNARISENAVREHEGIFNITSNGVNVPIAMDIQVISEATWRVQCTRV